MVSTSDVSYKRHETDHVHDEGRRAQQHCDSGNELVSSGQRIDSQRGQGLCPYSVSILTRARDNSRPRTGWAEQAKHLEDLDEPRGYRTTDKSMRSKA